MAEFIQGFPHVKPLRFPLFSVSNFRKILRGRLKELSLELCQKYIQEFFRWFLLKNIMEVKFFMDAY